MLTPLCRTVLARVAVVGTVVALAGPAAAAPHVAPVVAAGSVQLRPLARYGPASAAGTTAPSAQELDNQAALASLRSWLMDQPGFKDGEYLSSSDDLDNKAITILWYGNSLFLQSVLSEASRGIAVTVDHSLFSSTQYEEAAAKVLSAPVASDFGGLIPQTVSGDDTAFKGLVVRVAYKDGGVSDGRTATQTQLDAVAKQATLISGYPAKAVLSDAAHPATTRDTDTPAMNAGGLMLHGSGICSSGFAISLNNTTYTSTARHCTATPYTDRDNSSVSYGNTQQVVNLTQWRVLTQTGFYWMFDGNYATSNHKTVNGYGDVGINDYVFTSGGNSGTHANLKVTTLTAWWNDGYGVAEEIEAQAPNNGVAVMAGDSGGPVFFYHTDNVTVGASGMIQYYTGGVTGGCGSARDANPCGNKVGFTSAHATVNSIPGASLYTG